MTDSNAVPITLEGSFALHQMFRFHRGPWQSLERDERDHVMAEASKVLTKKWRPAAKKGILINRPSSH